MTKTKQSLALRKQLKLLLKQRKKIKKTKPANYNKKYKRFGNRLISGNLARKGFRKVAREFLNEPVDLEKKINDMKRIEGKDISWFQFAVTATMHGFTAYDSLQQLLEYEKTVKVARQRPARGIDPELAARLVIHSDKIGGAAKLLGSTFLNNFYKITKIPKIKTVKALNKLLTEYRRMLKWKVRSHDAFAGSEKEKQYMDKARKKLIDKGYLGKKYN